MWLRVLGTQTNERNTLAHGAKIQREQVTEAAEAAGGGKGRGRRRSSAG